MPRETKSYCHTFTEQTRHEIDDLSVTWGGLSPIPNSQVIREAVHRAWMAEFAGGNGREQKRPSKPAQHAKS